MLNDDITVIRVDTKNQLADMHTKPLAKDEFMRLRKLVIGW